MSELPAWREAEHRIPAAAMSEAELDRAIRRILADLPALRVYHTYDSRRSAHGFPDLVIVGPKAVMWRELKRQDGRLTGPQAEWLGALLVAGQDARDWRPDELLDGGIARELAALAGLTRQVT